jgi:hypothetical protein
MLVPSEAFSVRVESSNGAAHLRLSGRFDLVAVSSLGIDRPDAAARRRHGPATSFMDGAAWLAVMDFEHRAHDWGKASARQHPRPRPQDRRAPGDRPLIADTDRPPNGRGA